MKSSGTLHLSPRLSASSKTRSIEMFRLANASRNVEAEGGGGQKDSDCDGGGGGGAG